MSDARHGPCGRKINLHRTVWSFGFGDGNLIRQLEWFRQHPVETVNPEQSVTFPDREYFEMSDDYRTGCAQFLQRIGEENIKPLISRLRAVCPDLDTEVISVVDGRSGLAREST